MEVTRLRVVTEEDEEMYELPPGDDIEEYLLPMIEIFKRSRGKRLDIFLSRVKGERN